MPEVPREVIEHRLALRPDKVPVKQKLRRFSPDRRDAIRSELDKLLKAGFIREVDHPEWLANPVMVRKSNGKWRMCVDFTDLNKACLCSITSLGTPGTSDVCHAKTSALSRRKVMRASSY